MFNTDEQEKKVLKFWQEQDIFKKSIHDSSAPNFVFYEGPPTANAAPGIHHIEARAFKDIICRYKNMKGFYVWRKAGWDTHGLPVEIQIEKELGLNDKKGIEEYGVAEFNKKCQDSVWRYKKDWEQMTERIGFWLDLDHPYITYENEYIESVWWILKQIWSKGLLFQDYKIAPFCPRCGTTLSSHELAQGYQKVKEPAVYLKFKLVDQAQTSLLVWTTTPWTLPGNVAVAANPNLTYLKIKKGEEEYILAKETLEFLKEKDYQVIEEFSGQELIGLKYQPLYKAEPENKEKIYQVLAADFVSAEEGTGLVHIAPAFGEEDYQIIKEQPEKFAFLLTVDEQGNMNTPGYAWDKMFVKKADALITQDLAKRNILFREELYEHDYPFCWRCDTPLIYYAQSSWFIKMTALREKLLANNEKINWVPAHLKKGRFGEWLREVKDWNLSRKRFWGTPLPIWQCENEKCDHEKTIGSIKELEELSGQKIKNLHRPFIDEITFKCEQCGGTMKRVPEVIDCWFDSGSMPLAQQHYPFENKELVDQGKAFPADFICEGIDQTRGWFYTLLAIATLLDKGVAYENVVVTGIVLDEKGRKMSKSKGNIIVPQQVIEKYGADCIRFYLYTINQVDQPKKFSLKDLQDLHRKFFLTLNNCLEFWQMYAGEEYKKDFNLKSLDHVLDQWIISRLNTLIQKVNQNLEAYDIVGAARLFLDFVDDLSNWYIRRSRKRFQRPETAKEKETAILVLRQVLLEL
jgi:isoleucyl-tRNA synthetase